MADDTLLAKERRWVQPTSGLLVAVAATGYVTHLVAGQGVWQQWTFLAHIVMGLALVLALPVYLLFHFRRSVGVRRPSLIFTGLLFGGLLLYLAGSGLWTVWAGQTAVHRWVFDGHIWAAYAAFGAALLHLIDHRVARRPGSRLPATRFGQGFQTVAADTVVLAGWMSVAAGGAVLVATLLHDPGDPDRPIEPIAGSATDYQNTYGPHPFRPSETETRSGSFIAMEDIAGSARCAGCHAAIYRQWQSSLHAQAASDAAYVSNINLLVEKRGITAARYCEGCHAPVALLTGALTDGGEHGGISGTVANVEGVSCLACHAISRAVHLKGVASFEFAPAARYLFWASVGGPGAAVRDLLIKTQPEQHRRDMGRPILRSPELCATCHAQFMPEVMNSWGWIKLQDEYAAWLDSPFSGHSEQGKAAADARRCQDCHMPLVSNPHEPSARSAANTMSADRRPVRGELVARAHHTPGANTAIPAITGDAAQLAATRRFLRTDKLRVAIDSPSRPDPQRASRFVAPDARDVREQPYLAYLGEQLKLDVAITNIGVGHDFPGGTIDLNEAWVWLRVTDGPGNVVFESGAVDGDGFVDKGAHFYRATPIDRQGQEVWRHDLFNMVGESYRKTIPSGATDVVHYAFSIPHWAKGPLTATAALRYRKLNQRYANWALPKPHAPLPIVDVAQDAISVALEARPPVVGQR